MLQDLGGQKKLGLLTPFGDGGAEVNGEEVKGFRAWECDGDAETLAWFVGGDGEVVAFGREHGKGREHRVAVRFAAMKAGGAEDDGELEFESDGVGLGDGDFLG